ncbi:hypothetical protein XAC2852_810111 [Xanthomonas citri pv. citri]|nr:hypothetical protein XAC2852_810111 [Xanthomonas citri pv. citri]
MCSWRVPGQFGQLPCSVQVRVFGAWQQHEQRVIVRLQPGEQALHVGRCHRGAAGGELARGTPHVREDAAAASGNGPGVVRDDEALAVTRIACVAQIQAHRLGRAGNGRLAHLRGIDDAVVQRRAGHIHAVMGSAHRLVRHRAVDLRRIAERRANGEDAGRAAAIAFALLRALHLRRMQALAPGTAMPPERDGEALGSRLPFAIHTGEGAQTRLGAVPVCGGHHDQRACMVQRIDRAGRDGKTATACQHQQHKGSKHDGKAHAGSGQWSSGMSLKARHGCLETARYGGA